MKLQELEKMLLDGGVIVVTFYTRKITRHIDYKHQQNQITDKQFDKFRAKLVNFKNDFSGITQHFYKLKQ